MKFTLYRYDPETLKPTGDDDVEARSALELFDRVMSYEHHAELGGINLNESPYRVLTLPRKYHPGIEDCFPFDVSRNNDPDYVEQKIVECWELAVRIIKENL